MNSFNFFLGATAFWLTGCGVYAPLTPPTPTVSRNNPVQVTASYGVRGASGSLAFTPASHLIALVAGSSFWSDSSYLQVGDRRYPVGLQRQIEVAAGWHIVGDTAADNQNWYFGSLVGWGVGHTAHTYSDVTTQVILILPVPTVSNVVSYNTTYRKLFVQVYGVKRIGKIILSTGSLKVTHLHVRTLTAAAPDSAFLDAERQNPARLPSVYVEPSYNLGLHLGAFGFTSTIGASLPIGRAFGIVQGKLGRPTLMYDLGIVLNLGLLGRPRIAGAAPAPW